MSTRLKGRKKYVYKKYVYKMIITIIMFCLVLSINFVPSIKKKTDLKINYSLRRIHSFKILDLYPLPSGEGIWKTHDGKFEIVIKDGIVTFEHRAWERIEGEAGRAFAIYYSIQLRADNNGIEIKEIRSPTLAQGGFSDPKPEEIYHLVAPGQHLRGFVYTNDRKYNTQRPSLYIIVTDEFGEKYMREWDPFGEVERLLVPYDSPPEISYKTSLMKLGYFIRVITESRAKSLDF